MAAAGWYDLNSQRVYPLDDAVDPLATLLPSTVVRLPDATLVDFGVTLGPSSGYIQASDSIYLHTITRAGSVLSFTFRATTLLLTTNELVFQRHVNDPEFTTEYKQVTGPGTCGGLPLWDAWLVTGQLAGLVAILPDGGTLQCGTAFAINPVRVRTSNYSGLGGVIVANKPRTFAAPGPGCAGTPAPELPPDGVFVADECVSGPITIFPGFNCQVFLSRGDQSLTVNASQGAGAGFPCTEPKLFPDETRPVDSLYYGGGSSCKDLITSVNGLTGPDLEIEAGHGVAISADPDHAATVLIKLDLHDLVACPGG